MLRWRSRSTLDPMPEPRVGHTSAEFGGLLYSLGGLTRVRDGLSSVVRFDPASGSWSRVASLSVIRHYLVSFVLGGHLYAAGGTGAPHHGDFTVQSSGERYDAEADRWSPVGTMSTPRVVASGTVVGEGDVSVGGFDSVISRGERAQAGR